MKKVIICAIGLALATSLSTSAFGQNSDQVREMYEEYKKSQSRKSTQSTEKYKSPEIFEDTLANSDELGEPISRKESDSIDAVYSVSDKRLDREEAVSDKVTLRPFGYDMFTERSADFAPPEIATVPPSYKIGPGDNLLVSMWGRVDMEFDLTVNREGRVFIPKAGDIVCYGLSLDELQKRFHERLSKVYSEFKLSVTLGKIRTIKVYVYGEVKQPGGYTLSSLSTLFNALYAARGPNERGSMRKVRLLRGGETVSHVDLYDFLLSGDSSDDSKLESEDVVFVPLAGEMVTVNGEVRRPAIYELTGGEQIDEVIALAGGVKPTAYENRVMIDRISDNDSRKILDVDLASQSETDSPVVMQGGDEITVFSIDEIHDNVVFLAGHVKHPGAYQCEERPTVSDLIFEGDQLYKDTYLRRADLIRTNSESKQELIPIDLESIVSGDLSKNLQLQPMDSLVVYSIDDVTRDKSVTIKGEVTEPGEYRLFDNMGLSDLIFRAGNLTRKAFTLSAEIARLNADGVTELIQVDLSKLLEENDRSYDIRLAEDDQIFIRTIPDWKNQRTVTVEGEVRFPGEYALSHRGETLFDVIQRAGGLTERAFPKGAVFTRVNIAENLRRTNISDIIAKSAPLKEDSAGNVNPELFFDVKPENMNRIVIDLETALLSGHNGGNLSLRPGDRIFVPEAPSGVQVMGAVAASGTIHFEANKKPSYYIDRAGGLLRNSDRKGTRVVKADGRVLPWSKADGREIELGDAIIVPTQIKRDRDWWKILTSTATIVGGLATTVYIVDKL